MRRGQLLPRISVEIEAAPNPKFFFVCPPRLVHLPTPLKRVLVEAALVWLSKEVRRRKKPDCESAFRVLFDFG